VKHYIAEKWQDILVFNDLDSPGKVWALQADWFEKPNRRRGGWGGVSRIEIKLPLVGKVGMFLKRQEDHITQTVSHPIKGFSTFARKFDVIRKFQQYGIPTLDVVFFEEWKESGHQRAFIMTEELVGYIPLSSDAYKMGAKLLSTDKQKIDLFKKLSLLMHQHNCFYPKHVFAKQLPEGGVDLRVIDLEKAKKLFTKNNAVYRDLDTFLRHSNGWSHDDKLEFFKVHQVENELS